MRIMIPRRVNSHKLNLLCTVHFYSKVLFVRPYNEYHEDESIDGCTLECPRATMPTVFAYLCHYRWIGGIQARASNWAVERVSSATIGSVSTSCSRRVTPERPIVAALQTPF
jgi:hypothetical protein